MKDLVLGITYIIGFVFLVGSVGANEWGDISEVQLIIRALIIFVILFVLTVVLSNEFREVIADKWRRKKHSRTR